MDNEPAFPVREWDSRDGERTFFGHGMSLRDYFAAKAMQAIHAAAFAVAIHPASGPEHIADFMSIAHAAYKMADAMLTARGDAK